MTKTSKKFKERDRAFWGKGDRAIFNHKGVFELIDLDRS